MTWAKTGDARQKRLTIPIAVLIMEFILKLMVLRSIYIIDFKFSIVYNHRLSIAPPVYYPFINKNSTVI